MGMLGVVEAYTYNPITQETEAEGLLQVQRSAWGWKGSGKTRTATEVTKNVVALLRERDLVDSVANETSFQQVASILAGLPSIGESFHIVVQPVHHI